MPTAFEELASSPSSSDMSTAKKNRLSGESCAWKRKKTSYPKLTMQNLMDRVTYLLQGDFLSLAWRCSWHYSLIDWSCRWNIFNWKLPRVMMVFMKEIIGNDSIIGTLP